MYGECAYYYMIESRLRFLVWFYFNLIWFSSGSGYHTDLRPELDYSGVQFLDSKLNHGHGRTESNQPNKIGLVRYSILLGLLCTPSKNVLRVRGKIERDCERVSLLLCNPLRSISGLLITFRRRRHYWPNHVNLCCLVCGWFDFKHNIIHKPSHNYGAEACLHILHFVPLHFSSKRLFTCEKLQLIKKNRETETGNIIICR